MSGNTYHLVSENVGFTRKAQIYRNMWFGKRKDGSVGDEETLIPGWPQGRQGYGTVAEVSY